MDESPSRLPMPSPVPKKDGAKRRSLLLPPGTISGVTRRGLLSPTEEGPPKQRPMTMFGLPRALQSTKEEVEHEDEGESRSPSPESKEAARASAHAALMGGGRPQTTAGAAPKSGIARSTSIRVPASSRNGTGKPLEQSRSKIAGKPVSMLKESTSRPQSAASTAARPTAEASTSRLRAPAPSTNSVTGLRRSNTTIARHSRTQSALPPISASTTQPRTDTRRHPTISEGSSESKLHRPAFSTLQQHYSPKKNFAPKPASSSLINAQPVDTGSSLGLETQLLQTRLLQLSILHRQAEPNYQAWQLTARRALKHKFTDVAGECEVVRQKEKEWRRRINTAALKEWCKGDYGLLGEHIATLSIVLGEVFQLVEDGGRVHQVLEIFEAWITWVEAIYQGREQQGRRHADFVEGLGEGWKSEVGVLVRKLQGLVRQLDGLGRVEDRAEGGSSLVEVVSGLKTLTSGAVEELRLVEGLEGEVVKREGRWVDERIGSLGGEIDALLA